jgi:hypothetical protein
MEKLSKLKKLLFKTKELLFKIIANIISIPTALIILTVIVASSLLIIFAVLIGYCLISPFAKVLGGKKGKDLLVNKILAMGDNLLNAMYERLYK